MNAQQNYVGTMVEARPDDTRTPMATAGRFPLLLGVLLAIAALRSGALVLNGTDLYMDEAQYWAWSRDLAFGYFSKPPLIAWIIHGATSVCGESEPCIRAPSIILHLVTSLLIYGIGTRLYSKTAGFWSALGYALIPAVSLSSGIISTDVPLLAAWALALFAFAGLLKAPTARDTALLALAIGIGLNAKYAMAYFVPCAAIYFVAVTEHRRRLKSPHLWLALAGGIALIAPNLLWNATHGFVTFAHTADNANWTGIPFHPGKAAEFFLAQFGVFGPILFGGLLLITWRAVSRSHKIENADKLLLAFSIPIILIVTLQGLASRAHANWAAPAYVAAIVLVTAVMIRDRDWGWMRASFTLHVVLAIGIALATWQAGRFSIPRIGDPFARTLGNRELAAEVRKEILTAKNNGKPIGAVLTDDREMAAALTYYARDISVPLLSWREDDAPRSYFEMTKPFTPDAPAPLLFATPRSTSSVAKRFAVVTAENTRTIPAGNHATRTVHLSILDRYVKR
jgi:4-amino-4-deoxy-L-arabinose transferase-like glycosyltransferase